METKLQFSLLAILGILGIYLLGQGITGMATVRAFYGEICTTDAPCRNESQVCCYFYQENSGVCDLKQNCAAILAVTQVEAESLPRTDPLTALDDKSDRVDAFHAMLGIVVLLYAILATMHLLQYARAQRPKRDRTR